MGAVRARCAHKTERTTKHAAPSLHHRCDSPLAAHGTHGTVPNDVAKVQGNATFAPGDVVAALPVGLDELAMFECVH